MSRGARVSAERAFARAGRAAPRAASASAGRVPAVALVAFLLDALVMGQGLLALVMLLVVLVWFLPRAALARLQLRRPYQRRRYDGRVVAFTASAVAIMLVIGGNNRLAEHRGQVVASAIASFHDVTGRYPVSLDELVPAYLATVPAAKWSLVYDAFEYRSAPRPVLTYYDVPPLGRRTFDVEAGRWSSP